MEALVNILAGALVDAIGKAVPQLIKAFEDGKITNDELKKIGMSMLPMLFGTIAKPIEEVSGETRTGMSVTLNFPHVSFSAEDFEDLIDALISKDIEDSRGDRP